MVDRESVNKFEGITDPAEKVDTLREMISTAGTETFKSAVAKSSADTQKVAVEAGGGSLADLPSRDRKVLYVTVIYVLAILSAGALLGAGWALSKGKDGAAFFTFAGLALGGITGLFIPSPTGK